MLKLQPCPKHRPGFNNRRPLKTCAGCQATTRRVERRRQIELHGWQMEAYAYGSDFYFRFPLAELSLLVRVRPLVEAIDWGTLR